MNDDKALYAFIIEWYNPTSEVTKNYKLTYNDENGQIEMIEQKNNRTFLKVKEKHGIWNFRVNQYLNIASRNLKILNYADINTEKKIRRDTNSVFVLFQESYIEKLGLVIEKAESMKCKFTKAEIINFSENGIEKFRKVCSNKTENIFTAGSAIALGFIGSSSIDQLKSKILGESADFVANSNDENSNAMKFYFSCGDENVQKDWIATRYLKNEQIRNPLEHCTCCIIKPHILVEGKTGAILNEVISNGFSLSAMRIVHLTDKDANILFEVYRDVIPEHPSLVHEMTSGPCLALAIAKSSIGENNDVVQTFRAFVGPSDSHVAKKIRPLSIRAKFGIGKVQNAVHCSDIPENVEYELKLLFNHHTGYQ